MGYMRHHAIVVSAWSDDAIGEAYREALKIFGDSVTPVLPKVTNGYRTFLVGPDGSKEGWPESDEGNERRERFKTWLRSPPEGLYFQWAEVQYGDEDGNQRVVDASRMGDDD